MGVGAAGTSGAATGAQIAQGGQQSANQTGATGVQNLSGANSMLGVANTANQNSMSGVQDQFQDQQTSYQDAAAAQAAQMQQIGQVAGMAAMMEEGGPITFTRGIPVFANGGVVDNYSYVPPPFPQPARPRNVPNATRFLAGGKTTDYAAGGQVMQKGARPTSPIPGSTDTKPALLTPGEFVMPRDVVQHLGNDHFHRLIDKTREKANLRRAIPIHHPPHVS